MIFFGPSLVIFLKKDSLVIQGKSHSQTLTYPDGLFSHSELIDTHAWKKFIEDNLSKFGKSQKYLVVLDDSYVYKATYDANDKNIKPESDFAAQLPISPSDSNIINVKKQKLLIAGYTKPITILDEILNKHGFKLTQIIPYPAIGEGPIPNDPKLYSQILKKISSLNVFDLNLSKSKIKKLAQQKNTDLELSVIPNKTQIIRYLLLSSILILLWVLLFKLMSNQKTTSSVNLTSIITPTPTPEITSTPSPTPIILSKSEVSITVENGTGTPGQAKKVSDLLTSSGYSEITIKNATTPNKDKTTIFFKDRVDSTHKEEVKNSLVSLFTDIIESTASSEQTTDIYILTGIN